METKNIVESNPETRSLETFLGGMETRAMVDYAGLEGSLETFLGGMETILVNFLKSFKNFP